MSNLNKRLSALEQKHATPEDTLVQQAIGIWQVIGIELSMESAEQIASHFRKLGYSVITWELLCNVDIEMMRQL